MKPGPVRLRANDPLSRRRSEVIAALRLARVLARLSHPQVAARLGVHRKSVCNWENRTCLPDASTAALWHQVLGLAVPADVPTVFRPVIPRCPSRSAYERHKKRREACTTCREWFTEHRKRLKAERMRAVGCEL